MLESLLNPQVITGVIGTITGFASAYVTGRFRDRKSSREIDLEYDKFVQGELSKMFESEKKLFWEALENDRIRLNTRINELESRERQLQERIYNLEYQLDTYRVQANRVIAEKDKAIAERDEYISKLQQQLGTCQIALKEIHAKHNDLVSRVQKPKPNIFPAPATLPSNLSE
jgi:chromosome segregation ATPase